MQYSLCFLSALGFAYYAGKIGTLAGQANTPAQYDPTCHSLHELHVHSVSHASHEIVFPDAGDSLVQLVTM